MLPFGVTIPATVPQRSEIPEGLMNYLVHIRTYVYVCTCTHVHDTLILKHTYYLNYIVILLWSNLEQKLWISKIYFSRNPYVRRGEGWFSTTIKPLPLNTTETILGCMSKPNKVRIHLITILVLFPYIFPSDYKPPSERPQHYNKEILKFIFFATVSWL